LWDKVEWGKVQQDEVARAVGVKAVDGRVYTVDIVAERFPGKLTIG
jgi:hypothetical protein